MPAAKSEQTEERSFDNESVAAAKQTIDIHKNASEQNQSSYQADAGLQQKISGENTCAQSDDAGRKIDEYAKQSLSDDAYRAVAESYSAKNGTGAKSSSSEKETVSAKTSLPAKENASAEKTGSAKNSVSSKTSSAQKNTSVAKNIHDPQISVSQKSSAEVPAGGGAIEPGNGQQIKPQPLFVIPQAAAGATLYFVFDDAGQNVKALEKYTTLPFPIAVAVLPKLTYSKQCAQKIRASGNTVMLHQPMQALNEKINPGPGAITPNMSVQEIMNTIKINIAEIGPVAGLNNHEGSKITENEIQIGAVLDEAQTEGVFFLDSRTTAQTRAPQAALERGITIYERDVFLDDTVNRAAILEQVYRALDIANKKGKAVIIGHVDKSVDIIPALLREMYPDLVKKKYTFGKLK
jgi:uncharacterized protein